MKNLFEKFKDKLIEIIPCILILVTVGVLWLVNNAVPFMMDDLWYKEKLIRFEQTGTPITSFMDIVESQIWHYNNWGGRSITHGLLQIILQLGERIADILNVLAVLALAYAMCVMAKTKSLLGMFLALGMLLGMNANWRESMFWQSGAVNYLYITIFILWFLYCYLRDNPDKQMYGITLWIVPLGIVAGWSNENMGPTAWVLSLLVILIHVYQKKKVHLWMILGNLSCLIGSIMVVIAPGNFARSAEAAGNEYGVLWNIFLRCYAESKAAAEYLFLPIMAVSVVLFVAKGILNIEIGVRNRLLLLGALLSWGAMVLSPHYPDRATFGTMVLLICVSMSMIQKIVEKEKKCAGMLLGIGSLIWLRGMFFLGEYMATLWGWIK